MSSNQKTFLITVDTEGDNLWHWRPNEPITTENAKYIPYFQELCEKYGFIPVYLTNYEMAKDCSFMRYVSQKQREGKCEVGLHLHAWNTPPEFELQNRYGGNPYITEYPKEIVYEKAKTVLDLLENTVESKVISHRSGRWALNSEYLDVLASLGIEVDCSVTPELDLSGIKGYSINCGNDYSKAPKVAHLLSNGIVEIPMTTRSIRQIKFGTLKQRLYSLIKKDDMWLRPIGKSFKKLRYLTQKVLAEGADYLEFMIHSSELMPGGSPYFRNAAETELLYCVTEQYFRHISDLGFVGSSLSDYATLKRQSF